MLRTTSLILFFLIASLNLGCQKTVEPSESNSTVSSEETWDEQIVAVRDGRSKTIESTADLTSEEFLELQTGCESLTKLDCNVAKIDAESLQLGLSGLSKLTQLVLVGTQGNAVLESVSKLSTIRILNLSKASVDDDGLTLLEAHSNIELVRIESKKLTDIGLMSITKIPNLRFLHLINTSITDTGLLLLYRLEGLESFYLDGGACTDEGLSELVKAMPGLHFHWNQLHLEEDPHGHSHE